MAGPLTSAHAVTKIPAQDLDRARRFYRDRLGLEPVEEREGGLRYVCGATEFHLFLSSGSASGASSQMGFEVTDIDRVVATCARADSSSSASRSLTSRSPASRWKTTSCSRPTTTQAREVASAGCSSATARATCSASGRRRADESYPRAGVPVDTPSPRRITGRVFMGHPEPGPPRKAPACRRSVSLRRRTGGSYCGALR